MPDPTPLEIAHALRSAAEFCRDPNSPKCHFALSLNARGEYIGGTANDPDAAQWCGLGYLGHLLDVGHPCDIPLIGQSGLRPCLFADDFNHHRYEKAATRFDAAAASIEAALPEAPAVLVAPLVEDTTT